MIRLNNKGQSLVMFIIFMPVLLLMLTLVYDIGNGLYEKEKISNVNYMAVSYGLDNIDKVEEQDLIDIIMKNTNNLDNISVNIENDTIDIKIDKDIKGIIGGTFNVSLIEVRSEYTGKIIDGNKNIERIKWYYGW